MPIDSKLLFVLQMLAAQLDELWCSDELLNSVDCPVLNLKKLKLGVEFNQTSYRVRPVLLGEFFVGFVQLNLAIDFWNFCDCFGLICR
jgi:hypothetical protein